MLTRLSLFAKKNIFFEGGAIRFGHCLQGVFFKTACGADLAR
jgi:hypothetical protein